MLEIVGTPDNLIELEKLKLLLGTIKGLSITTETVNFENPFFYRIFTRQKVFIKINLEV